MTLVQSDSPAQHFSASAREVYDVTGAGDTVIAAMAGCMSAGLSMQEAVRYANHAAGVVVAKLGTASVTPAELQHAVAAGTAGQPSGNLSVTDTLSELGSLRAAGKRIVMTNGCFDLIHPGHIHYLQQASALGDVLVVAVNDDDSVKRLKGPSRPLNGVEDRMAVLSALQAVDYVLPFSEDTPAGLIETVAPDVLVKGGDYTVEQIAGHEFVLGKGGDVIVLDFVPGHSTSGLIERLGE